MPREITVALVQMAPALANPEANLRKMGDFVERICSEQNTDLIVFPELSYTGTELGLRATSPEGAFYTMLDVRSIGDDVEVAEKFLQNRVVTVPGVAFGSEAKGFLRTSFCNSEERMAEGVRRMKEALAA